MSQESKYEIKLTGDYFLGRALSVVNTGRIIIAESEKPNEIIMEIVRLPDNSDSRYKVGDYVITSQRSGPKIPLEIERKGDDVGVNVHAEKYILGRCANIIAVYNNSDKPAN